MEDDGKVKRKTGLLKDLLTGILGICVFAIFVMVVFLIFWIAMRWCFIFVFDAMSAGELVKCFFDIIKVVFLVLYVLFFGCLIVVHCKNILQEFKQNKGKLVK